ncbi:MAG: flagellar hook-associated protein FlgK [Pseudomonadota bacterium]
MSLNLIINSATSSLKALQSQIQVASGNIANARDADYTRKRVETEPLIIDGSVGGTRVRDISRSIDRYLRADIERQLGVQSAAATLAGAFRDISAITGANTGRGRLVDVADRFAAAWRGFETSPENAAAQREVLTSAQAVVEEIKAFATGLDTLKQGLTKELQDTVAALNPALVELGDLNRSYIAAKGRGESTAQFEDRRDAVIRDISAMVAVQRLDRSDGTVALYSDGGALLFDVVPSQFAVSGTTITKLGDAAALNSSFAGGKIGALVKLLASDAASLAGADPATAAIAKLESQLDAFAQQFTGTAGPPATFAGAYDAAIAVAGDLASGFFQAINGGLAVGRFNFQVNPNLLSGAAKIKAAAATAVANTFIDATRGFTAAGLSISGTTYLGMASGIVGRTLEAQRRNDDLKESVAATLAALESRRQSVSGVNMDEELAGLTALQTSYAATARIISVVDRMFQDILDIVR